MDLKMASALAGEIPNVAAFCRAHGISRQTFYKWRARVLTEGVNGLAERSRAPRGRPSATPVEVEELLIRTRKELLDDGRDAGPQSVLWELTGRGVVGLPCRATIASVFTRRGQVLPAPQKRPRSSYRRFTASRPNELWQQDWTQWRPPGVAFCIAGVIDDHSRYLVGLRAGVGDATLSDTWQALLGAVTECGVPHTSLTDNGMVYANSRHRGGPSAYQDNLRALGVRPITSTPGHPQTCGKIERFWQTLKRWLRARDPATTVTELQDQLDAFRAFYNHQRPHRALKSQTPATVYTATVKARPSARPLPAPTQHHHLTVQKTGQVSSTDFVITISRTWAGKTVDVIIEGTHAAVFHGPQLIRELDIKPRTKPHKAP